MNTVEIKQSTDVEKDLTTFTVEGRVQVNDLIQGVENFYQGEYTLNVLVDLTLAPRPVYGSPCSEDAVIQTFLLFWPVSLFAARLVKGSIIHDG